MNKEHKLIFLDIDGTLVDVHGTVPESTRRAIEKAQANGHICVINTGRPYAHIVDEVKSLGIEGYICSCGQYLSINGRILKDERFNPEESREIIRIARECRVDLFIESEHGLFHDFAHPMTPGTQAEFNRFRKRGFDVDASVDEEGFFFSKICAWEFEDSDMPAFLERVSKYLYVLRHEGRMREMVKNGSSKADGIREFLEAAGYLEAETYALGDSGNDTEMLRSVMHGIAMGNASQSLKEMAEYVTTDLHSDGVWNAFAHYGLI